ncbi:arginine--tRNA ligase [Candidatus Gracilibacteria bacterium]|nr:arginine--tRNA ligase [Candidatus Gracilibacteria bacterium]
MKLRVDPKIFQQNPDLKIGVILLKGIDNKRRLSTVDSLLRGICARRAKEFTDTDILNLPTVRPWADAYAKFGVNPNKYPPAIGALLTRIKAGKEIPHINLLVDLCNHFSLQHLLPVGGEDLDKIHGDLALTYTKGGEPFRAIGEIEVKQAKEGEIAYIDQAGITCRYWNHRECDRSKFTSETKNALILIEDLSKIHLDEFGAIIKEFQNIAIKYIGGQIEPYIITEETSPIDLGIKGLSEADDSKVLNKDKAHFIVQQAIAENKKPKPAPKPVIETSIITAELLKHRLELTLQKAAKAAFPDHEIHLHLEYPRESTHGDYACSIALQLSKKLNIPPQEIAAMILEKLQPSAEIAKTEIAGPGFINIFLSKETLQAEIDEILQQKDQYGQQLNADKTVILEYSSPNIAKPLGVHHLLSTVIGQSLYNLYKFLGFKVISINHIGDWGTQFGRLIAAYKKWGDKATIEKDPINELLKLYIQFHDEEEKKPTLADEGRAEFRKFEAGDSENRALWQWFVDESLKALQKTYDHLGGIHFDQILGESFYEDKMTPIIDLGLKKGIITEGEEGALVLEFAEEGLATVPVRKKDGTTLYITRDLATIDYRIKNHQPAKILYFVDVAQSLHFEQLFTAARKMNLCQDQPVHVKFGRMSLPEGKMSTRTGTAVLLDEVLTEAEERAAKLITEKNPDLQDTTKLAHIIGVGAVKYAILSQNRTTNVTFEWDKILSLEGNSAPYLQYTYARAKSILRKQEASGDQTAELDPKATAVYEDLERHLTKFKEQLIIAAEEYKPNLLSNYIYELAQKFNTLYAVVPILKIADQKEKHTRLKLVEATSQILKTGLSLLGVEVAEEM